MVAVNPVLKITLNVISRILSAFFWMNWVEELTAFFLSTRIRLETLAGAIKIAGSWNSLKRQFGQRLPVLLYHHVGPERPGTFAGLTVSQKKFQEQVRWLSERGFQLITSSDWLNWCRMGKGLPPQPVLMTFDDAYFDLAEYALPAIHQRGFGAEIMIVSGLIGATNKWNEKELADKHKLMTEEQIRDWNRKGIEFGAHSRTHPDLRTLQDLELNSEVEGSRDDLGKILGSRPRSFAFPYGHYNEAVLRVVRENFDLAFTVEEGLNTLGSDLHRLRRSMVLPRESLFEFGLRVRLGRNPLIGLRRAISPIKKFVLGRRA
jgi:peptidoglycan/xylan/chitin deacetylase (PgdA/CDA1 family)